MKKPKKPKFQPGQRVLLPLEILGVYDEEHVPETQYRTRGTEGRCYNYVSAESDLISAPHDALYLTPDELVEMFSDFVAEFGDGPRPNGQTEIHWERESVEKWLPTALNIAMQRRLFQQQHQYLNMSNQTNEKIAYEVGQEVCVRGIIVNTYPEQGVVDVLLKDGANVPLGTPSYNTSQVVPVPREGEYSLTLKEIEWLVYDYQDEKQSVRGVESIADFVKGWLENR